MPDAFIAVVKIAELFVPVGTTQPQVLVWNALRGRLRNS